MSPTAEKKRPGRKPAKSPRNAYLNIRIKPGEFDNLRAHADARGLPYSELVRQQLGSLLTRAPRNRPVETEVTSDHVAEPEVTEEPTPPVAEDQERTVDLAAWIADRVGLPVALARAHIGNGRIWVGGEVCRDVEIPHARVQAGVTFDGSPI